MFVRERRVFALGARGDMTAVVSDRLRESIERLDQTIDRLDASVALAFERPAPEASVSVAPSVDGTMLAERLDKIIERLEAALVE
jgi:hypothetical protein